MSHFLLGKTNTLYTALDDAIFADGFESGGLNGWSSSVGGSDLSVNANAALAGGYGLRITVSNSTASREVINDSPANEPRYRARFYFDPNSISIANGNSHYIFYGYYTSASLAVFQIEFGRSSGGGYQIQARVRDDLSNYTESGWSAITDAPHVIEFDWRAATAPGANNGGLTLWIDGVQQANITGVNNDTRRVDRARLGAVYSLDNGNSGSYYFDAFESRRQYYIGSDATLPDVIFADGFEADSPGISTFSAWASNSNGGGDLKVSTAAAIVGGRGLQAFINDPTPMYVRDYSPANETHYRARFYFDPNSITMLSGHVHVIFDAGTSPAFQIQLVCPSGNSCPNSSGYQLKAQVHNNGSTWTNGSYYTISDTVHSVEVDWTAAAPGTSNGTFNLWIDGVLTEILSGISNDAQRVDQARLGPAYGLDDGTSGTEYFDAFESHRQAYIGPRPILAWERSHEADTINALSVGNPLSLSLGLSLPTYPDNVWDQVTRAYWIQRNPVDIRHFKATFTIPSAISPSVSAVLFDPYYSTDIVPINDNIYVYVNGVLKFTGGTNYPVRLATGNVPETDGWYIPGGIMLDGFQTGQNVIDILTEERQNWGALGYLDLRFIP